MNNCRFVYLYGGNRAGRTRRCLLIRVIKILKDKLQRRKPKIRNINLIGTRL